jgi:hypothetical protein
MKIKCYDCGKLKPLSQFHKRTRNARSSRMGRNERCKKCTRIYCRKYHQENRDRYKNRHLEVSYGITLSDYSRLYEEQEGRCAICLEWYKVLHVDHDHETNKVRGLLCLSCNNGLGRFRDSPERLRRAIQYLNEKE